MGLKISRAGGGGGALKEAARGILKGSHFKY